MATNGAPLLLAPLAPHRTAAANPQLLPGRGFVLVGTRLRSGPILRQLRGRRQDPAILHQGPGHPAHLHCEGAALQQVHMAGDP